jgi:hypothetical protein
MRKYIVLIEFADKNNIAKHYKPGDELPGELGEDRLANIVRLGLAKVESAKAESTDIDLTAKVTDIIAQVKELTDVEKLNQYLEAEKSADKPRQMVIKAIEAQLANIVKE